MRKKIAAGNWKMNLGPAAARQLVTEFLKGFDSAANQDVEIILAVPFIDLMLVAELIKDHPQVKLAAQNLHQLDRGAYTGEISAEMLAEAGCEYVLVGHSERREYFHEGDALLLAKARQALKFGLKPIFCFGEQLKDREADQTYEVLKGQLENGIFQLDEAEFENVVLAYEPVWAIGTGKTASPEQAQEVHAWVRHRIHLKYGDLAAKKTSILYGGSVKPDNAMFLFACPDIDGGLVGGACLKADDFVSIAGAFL